MALLPQSVEQLARLGANIEISNETKFMPQTLENIVRLAAAGGGTVSISINGLLPQTLENLARIGGNHVTFRI